MSFYDSVLVFERGSVLGKNAPVIGKPDLSYKLRKIVPPILRPLAKRIKRIIF